jgi:hypothetical protein
LFLPTQVLYPLPNNLRQLRDPSDKQYFITPATFAIHHWSCSWQDQDKEVQDDAPAKEAKDAAAKAKSKAASNASHLIALAQSIQRMNGGQAAAAAAPTSTSTSASTAASSSSSSSSAPSAAGTGPADLNPSLLGKIAAFLK